MEGAAFLRDGLCFFRIVNSPNAQREEHMLAAPLWF